MNKSEIQGIKSEKPNTSANQTYDMFKKPDKNVLADKFSYEAIICEVNERVVEPTNNSDKKSSKAKERKPKKNTLEFYQEQATESEFMSEKINYKEMGVYNEKRVSLSNHELISNLLDLFKQQEEYKLNDLVEILNHPILPLKKALKELADYDHKRKLYSVKRSLIW